MRNIKFLLIFVVLVLSAQGASEEETVAEQTSKGGQNTPAKESSQHGSTYRFYKVQVGLSNVFSVCTFLLNLSLIFF